MKLERGALIPDNVLFARVQAQCGGTCVWLLLSVIARRRLLWRFLTVE